MASASLVTLPRELIALILEQLSSTDDLRNISLLNSFWRRLCSEWLFRSVRTTNRDGDALLFSSLVRQYGHYIKSLNFTLTVPSSWRLRADDKDGNTDGRDQKRHKKGEGRSWHKSTLLPESIRFALSGRTLPNLQRILVHFDFDFTDQTIDWGGLESDRRITHIHRVPDRNYQEVLEAESRCGWHALMAQTWHAIARNEHIKELVLQRTIAKSTSVFFTDQWRKFLSQLQHVDIRLDGSDHRDGIWNDSLGYRIFVSLQLHDLFFEHLHNLDYLRLRSHPQLPLESSLASFKADYHTPVGLTEGPQTAPLGQDISFAENKLMRKLTKLELHGCFISPALVDFLTSDSNCLRRLELHECFARSSYWTNRRHISWGDFFQTLRECATKLSHFALVDSSIRNPDKALPDVEGYQFLQICQLLRAQPHRLIFSYGYLDIRHCKSGRDQEWSLQKLTEGIDQLEYNQLMDSVALNKVSFGLK